MTTETKPEPITVEEKCGYCLLRAPDVREAFIRYGPRKQDRYDYPTKLCGSCREYLRGRFAYAKTPCPK